jgi:hypothetical protein
MVFTISMLSLFAGTYLLTFTPAGIPFFVLGALGVTLRFLSGGAAPSAGRVPDHQEQRPQELHAHVHVHLSIPEAPRQRAAFPGSASTGKRKIAC